MSIFDLLKEKNEIPENKEAPSLADGVSDILNDAIKSGVEKALAELEAKISLAEKEVDSGALKTEAPPEQTFKDDIDPEIAKITEEIKAIRADIQKGLLSPEQNPADLDPDKALATMLGLPVEKEV